MQISVINHINSAFRWIFAFENRFYYAHSTPTCIEYYEKKETHRFLKVCIKCLQLKRKCSLTCVYVYTFISTCCIFYKCKNFTTLIIIIIIAIMCCRRVCMCVCVCANTHTMWYILVHEFHDRRAIVLFNCICDFVLLSNNSTRSGLLAVFSVIVVDVFVLIVLTEMRYTK